MLLTQVCRAHRNLVAGELDKIKVAVGQDHFLFRLAIEDGMSHAGLAEALCVDASTVTKTVSRLERDKVIERRPDPADRRSSRVYLTTRGRALVKPVLDIWSETEGRLTAGMTDAERGLLSRLLSQVLKNIT